MRILCAALATSSCFLLACPHPAPPPPVPPTNQNRVDLRAQQTPIKNQGSRGTCITFSATAAVEAVYRRGGVANLDLAEEFLNHTGKTFWLHPNWNDANLPAPEIGTHSAGYRENQVAIYGGGGGAGYIRMLANGLRLVPETTMPYLPNGADPTLIPEVTKDWTDPYWDAQLFVNNVDLHPGLLHLAALTSTTTFSVTDYKNVNPNAAADIEATLAAGHEVVWDFMVEGTNDPIWRTCAEQPGVPCSQLGGHSVLIVGFDKTDADAKNHYFIIKNSWGPTTTPGANGFTYISYDYLRNGYSAAYVNAVVPIEAWPELSAIGRWKTTWNGADAALDLYHLPGTAQPIFDDNHNGITDRRFGVLLTTHGEVFRVNGAVSGKQVTLYLSEMTPNTRWDDESGHRFELTLAADAMTLSGQHYAPGSATPAAFSAARLNDATGFRALADAINAGSIGSGADVSAASTARTPVPLMFGDGFLPVR